jgi:hypothetical protein
VSTSTPVTTRPGSVTIVVVLTWITAILDILGGILLLVLANIAGGPVSNVPAGFLWFLGIFYIILGLVIAWVAVRLGQGGRGARMLLTIVQGINILVALGAWISAGTMGQATNSVIGIVIAVIILALVWNQRANDFFASSS